jgi:hypothetical protein
MDEVAAEMTQAKAKLDVQMAARMLCGPDSAHVNQWHVFLI